MTRGRPTVYSDAILVKAQRYVNALYPSKKGKSGVEELFPTVEGLAIYLGVARDTIYDWSKDDTKKDFSYIVKTLMSKQGINLIHGGVSGKYQPKITALMLAKHNYVEKTETDVTSGGKPLETNIAGIINKVYGNNEPKQ